MPGNYHIIRTGCVELAPRAVAKYDICHLKTSQVSNPLDLECTLSCTLEDVEVTRN